MTVTGAILRYSPALAVLLLAVTLQTSGSFSFFGIVPNLALGALIALLFYFESFSEVAALSVLAALALNWTGGLPWELVALLGTVVAAFLAKQFIPWHFALEAALLTAGAALLFALLADPAYPFSYPGRFGVELLYTEVAAFIALGLFMVWYGAPQKELS